MDLKEAKLILGMYRPNGQDAMDPAFAEALELVKRDPELGHWFEQERSIDTLIANRVQEIPVPQDLRDSLLAANKVVPMTKKSWLPRFYAMAAVLILSISSFLVWNISQEQKVSLSYVSYASDATNILTPSLQLDKMASSFDELQTFLKGKQWPNIVLPDGLKSLSGLGCKGFEWQGKRVSLICFRPETGNPIHLFAINETNWEDKNLVSEPIFSEQGDWQTATWTAGGVTYLLAGDQNAGSLARFF